MEEIPFSDIKGDTPFIEVESLCMSCEKNGITRIMLTKIPYFKEVILLNFHCTFCKYENRQVQYGGAIEEKGKIHTCVLNTKEDYSRQIVRSEYASIRLYELDLELPNTLKNGMLTTIEGLIQRIIDDLSMEQAVRKVMNPGVYDKIEDLISKMKDHLSRYSTLTISIDDPSGNSFIESLNPPNLDPKLKIKFYGRSKEQNEALGLFDRGTPQISNLQGSSSVPEEVSVFNEPCYSCGVLCETRMCILQVPNFQEIIVMSSTCERCGYKSNEVKPSGSIATKGKSFTLRIGNVDDLSRDVVKSDSCKMRLPELQFESILSSGKYTTVEGLLLDLIRDFRSYTPFMCGDSATPQKKETIQSLIEKLEKVIALEPGHEITLVLDDPLGNSFIQSFSEEDQNLIIAEYTRSYEQNEEFGINHLKVDDYS